VSLKRLKVRRTWRLSPSYRITCNNESQKESREQPCNLKVGQQASSVDSLA
jgi:hypothetical protein